MYRAALPNEHTGGKRLQVDFGKDESTHSLVAGCREGPLKAIERVAVRGCQSESIALRSVPRNGEVLTAQFRRRRLALNESRPVAGELLFRQPQVHDRHLIKSL